VGNDIDDQGRIGIGCAQRDLADMLVGQRETKNEEGAVLLFEFVREHTQQIVVGVIEQRVPEFFLGRIHHDQQLLVCGQKAIERGVRRRARAPGDQIRDGGIGRNVDAGTGRGQRFRDFLNMPEVVREENQVLCEIPGERSMQLDQVEDGKLRGLVKIEPLLEARLLEVVGVELRLEAAVETVVALQAQAVERHLREDIDVGRK
jgi:hypothetical protein